MKRIFTLLVIFLITNICIAEETKTNKSPWQLVYVPPKDTIWIGHPMVSDNDAYTPSQGWLPGYKIGLREDGVVVWEEVTPKAIDKEMR